MKFIFENIIGIMSITILVLNTFVLSCLLIPLGIIKFFLPLTALKVLFTKFIIKVGELWIFTNKIWVKALHNPKWQIIGKENIKSDGWTIATSNHQSFADIFLLQDITNRKMPMLKFFMKYVLIYVPVIGLSWWALDMPFLKRYTKKQLENNPELHGKDVREMKRALKHYALYPVTVFSFAEGTRFTIKKNLHQKSPFKNLLKPKEGGLATALSLVNEIDSLIDFTIKFDTKKRSFWDYLCGRMNSVKVIIREIKIPAKFLNIDLLENKILRSEFKDWLHNIWNEKDTLIGK
ncbi:MAG: hypothetical protein CBD19_00980 [Gammaproteobacteria bacterium TMED159]|nr:MAG: hypothetical protein CBD19_00980 [Gammaproteobacteria bacterium TMED159]